MHTLTIADIERSLFSKKFRAITIGNAIEYMDFAVYGAFADVIGQEFFPYDSSDDKNLGLLRGLAIFGAAFLMRPFGGIIMGYIGDRSSREKALEMSILLMVIPTLCLVFIPNYASAGLISTIALVTCRLMQGLACGGEMVGAFVYVLEEVPGDYGYWGAMCKATAVFGCAVGLGGAALVRSILSEEDVQRYGWRLPFVFSSLLALLGWKMRRDILLEREQALRLAGKLEDASGSGVPVATPVSQSQLSAGGYGPYPTSIDVPFTHTHSVTVTTSTLSPTGSLHSERTNQLSSSIGSRHSSRNSRNSGESMQSTQSQHMFEQRHPHGGSIGADGNVYRVLGSASEHGDDRDASVHGQSGALLHPHNSYNPHAPHTVPSAPSEDSVARGPERGPLQPTVVMQRKDLGMVRSYVERVLHL